MDKRFPVKKITYLVYDYSEMTVEQINYMLDYFGDKLEKSVFSLESAKTIQSLKNYHSTIMNVYFLLKRIKNQLGINDANKN